MSDDHNHEELIQKISKQFKELFEKSEQAVYVYLDDHNKLCNQKFSTMLGYQSPQEWAAVTESFPTAFVEVKSQETLIGAYQKAIEKLVGSAIDVTWKKKTGGNVKSRVILVPFIAEGHLFALHFIS